MPSFVLGYAISWQSYLVKAFARGPREPLRGPQGGREPCLRNPAIANHIFNCFCIYLLFCISRHRFSLIWYQRFSVIEGIFAQILWSIKNDKTFKNSNNWRERAHLNSKGCGKLGTVTCTTSGYFPNEASDDVFWTLAGVLDTARGRGVIREQCPPNFVVPRKICFKHII